MRTDGRFIQNEIFASKTITPNFLFYDCHRAIKDTIPHKFEENISSTLGIQPFFKWLPSLTPQHQAEKAQGQTNQSTIVM